MIRIGLKSLVLGLVVTGLAAYAACQHLFDVRRVLSLQPEVLWLIGCLASLASLGLSYFLRSHSESPYHLAIGREDFRQPGSLPLVSMRGRGLWIGLKDLTPAREFGRFGFPFIAGLGVLIFGLIILENRSLMLLKHFYHNLTKDYGHVCPKEGEEPKSEKPEKMGCELVRKAFTLGYTKDLGDCAEDDAEKDEVVCMDRQWDEPGAHYSFRLIQRFVRNMIAGTQDLKHSLKKENLSRQLETLPSLADSHAKGFLGVPRTAIHIFTDLPEPGGFVAKMRRRLHPNHCQDELRDLRFRMAEKGEEPGAQLEDTLSHLLFSPAVGKNSYYCRPFMIHWAAAANTCAEIMAQGEAALDTFGIRDSVTAVMERQRLEESHPPPVPQAKPGQQLPGKPPEAEESQASANKKARARVSFHCLMSHGSSTATRGTLKLAGQTFTVDAVVLPAPGPDGLFPTHELFAATTQAFVADFNYTNLDRNAPLSLSEDRFRNEIARAGNELMLAKFELLRSSDVLAGDQWVYRYPDFMDVYPWQPHMANFVSRFRRAYQQSEEKP